MATTPRLAMAYLVASQAQKEVTHNAALNDLDALTQASVLSRTLATPPSSPSTGDAYIVPASASGAWSGYTGYLASYYGGWVLKQPKAGWRVWSQADGRYLYYSGSAWGYLASPFLETTFTWAPGTLASGAGATSSSQTLSGAALGDFVLASAPYDLSGVSVTAYVSAANTVVLRAQNGTSSSVTLASGTWRVRVQKV